MSVIVILGPTASGKTGVSVELAKLMDGEIISADSMQIYRGMDIGTAKVTPEETQGIRHHLVDFLEPDQSFSVAEFKERALNAIRDIESRGRQPIICGGTGLYIDALIKNIDFSQIDTDEGLRQELFAFATQNGNQKLHDRLAVLDPFSAESIHPNNVKRVVRAIEICLVTGKPFSEYRANAVSTPGVTAFQLFGLLHPREVLYSRINKRVELMFEEGLLEEARRLYDNGLIGTASQAIGYKELVPFFENEVSLDEAKEKIMMETRRYAKRQMTWFRRYSEVEWMDCSERNSKEIAISISQKLSMIGQ